ncbi:MAG: hypothetical protein AAF798_07130 [Bacteroidota bacterium]
MKNLILFISALFLATAFLACEKDDTSPSFPDEFDAIPTDRYSSTDPFAGVDVYGTWEVASTFGGFAGQGYSPNFDLLLLKANGIFGLVRNDSLIANGELRRAPNEWAEDRVLFLAEEQPDEFIELLFDNEKELLVAPDTIHFRSFCCDRFDTILTRVAP